MKLVSLTCLSKHPSAKVRAIRFGHPNVRICACYARNETSTPWQTKLSSLNSVHPPTSATPRGTSLVYPAGERFKPNVAVYCLDVRCKTGQSTGVCLEEFHFKLRRCLTPIEIDVGGYVCVCVSLQLAK